MWCGICLTPVAHVTASSHQNLLAAYPLMCWLQGYTPDVGLIDTCIVFKIDAGKQNISDLLQECRRQLIIRGLTACIGIGSTPWQSYYASIGLSNWLADDYRLDAFYRCSSQHLHIAPAVTARLLQDGLLDLNSILALPTAVLARRYSSALAQHIQQLMISSLIPGTYIEPCHITLQYQFSGSIREAAKRCLLSDLDFLQQHSAELTITALSYHTHSSLERTLPITDISQLQQQLEQLDSSVSLIRCALSTHPDTPPAMTELATALSDALGEMRAFPANAQRQLSEPSSLSQRLQQSGWLPQACIPYIFPMPMAVTWSPQTMKLAIWLAGPCTSIIPSAVCYLVKLHSDQLLVLAYCLDGNNSWHVLGLYSPSAIPE